MWNLDLSTFRPFDLSVSLFRLRLTSTIDMVMMDNVIMLDVVTTLHSSSHTACNAGVKTFVSDIAKLQGLKSTI